MSRSERLIQRITREIIFNYLKEPDDVQDWRRAVRLTREIMNQPALDPFNAGEFSPGEGVQSDEEIDAWVRANAETAYHPSGTCKMGAEDDPMAVIDLGMSRLWD